LKEWANYLVDGGLSGAAREEIQPVRDPLLADPITSLAPGLNRGRGELHGVCCVDPSKVAASRAAPRPDLLQALGELGERSAKSITGGQFGGEFVVAAA
jgi:hypothetical protein